LVRCGGGEFGEQGADAAVDLVTDRAYFTDGLASGVGQVPVQVALAGVDRAGVAARTTA
jgi:hypothetical protein